MSYQPTRGDIDRLWDFTYKEGRRVAALVKIGEITRVDVEEMHRLYPTDLEPTIALFLLDGGTYETATERFYPK